MSLFSDAMASAATANNAIFGDAATLRRGVTGTYIPCDVEVEFEVEIQPDGYEVEYMERVTTLEALVSEVGAIERGDTFDITSGDTYTVRRILENNGQFVKVVVDGL